MPTPFAIDPDITVAAAMDAAFYRDPAVWALARERIFARTWQWLGEGAPVAAPGSLAPRTLLPGLLDEPLLLARDEAGVLRCLSNVCTHRGNLLVAAPCRAGQIRCGYHSRRFDLAGRMTFMPEFGGARDFPAAADDLPQLPHELWQGHCFAALEPAAPWNAFFGDMRERLSWLPVDRFVPAPGRERDYTIAAHWALYVDNYLEGLHIPYVHPGLNEALDYGTYASELFRYANLQIAYAREGEPAFDPPAASPDHGRRVAAYYWWVFPNLMFNFYPWGLSLNVVLPEGPERTRVLFRSYVGNPALLDAGAGGALDQVEREDEAVVEAVQRGMRSRLYRRGRYSPSREQGVHHFHRLLAGFLQQE